VEEALLLESLEDFVELSLVDLAVVSDFESETDVESLVDLVSDEDELSLLEPFLLSDGGLGRP
ncbi:uncharacterized protein METZ01_LOCUS33132, partial [marine metagenome]|tara:strand:- start:173 stop:361 length:189 start_codon:yes stop_codon:yes gene_type:complete